MKTFASIAIAMSVAAVAVLPVRAAQNSPASNGIKVHGHWTFEIRNPDGSLDRRVEFQNALASITGPSILSMVLGRQATPGYWTVMLYTGNGNQGGACLSGTSPSICSIHEPNTNFSGSHSRNLTLDAPATGPNAGKLVLTGTVTAQNDAIIDGVVTQVLRCPATGSPSTPCNGPIHTFTVGNPPAQSVVAGQSIQVTVVFSFS